MVTAEDLVRKQIMVSADNNEKLDKPSSPRGASAADMEGNQSLELVSERQKEESKETASTMKRLHKALKMLES